MMPVGRQLSAGGAKKRMTMAAFGTQIAGWRAVSTREISTSRRQRHLDPFQTVAHRLRQFDHIWIVRNILGRPFAERSHERSAFDGEL